MYLELQHTQNSGPYSLHLGIEAIILGTLEVQVGILSILGALGFARILKAF